MAQENRTLRLLKRIVRRRYRRICINPANVSYIQYPEFRDSQRVLARPQTRQLGGNWDQTLDREVFWCSVYEPTREDVIGMVPMHNYVFYQSLDACFNNGESLQNSRWYRWMVDQQQNNPIRRYGNQQEVAERLAFLKGLYSDFSSGLYRDDPVDRPIINIGRQGKMAVEDGRHRLCVARVAGLKEFWVDINVIHADVPPGSI